MSYKADFLWGFSDDSVEEAGYEFANANTPEYQEMWWDILKTRLQQQSADIIVKLQKRIKELEDDRHIRREIVEDICPWGKDTCG